MRKFILVLMAGLFATSAFAADATCDAKATEKKLAGAAKTSFIKKCEADAKAPKSCDTQAADKKLAGAAKTSFMKKCEAETKGAAPAAAPAKAAAAPATAKGADAQKVCENKAAEKKLAGAAKNSFVKKCVADASK